MGDRSVGGLAVRFSDHCGLKFTGVLEFGLEHVIRIPGIERLALCERMMGFDKSKKGSSQ